MDVVNNEKEQQFEILLDGEKASLTYRFYKKDIAFMHTTVPEAMAGKGIASTLAVAAFDYAKKHHKPVMVYCPFVAQFITKHPEYKQQLDPEYHK
jgi:predicted GNAT family acetyltransferase